MTVACEGCIIEAKKKISSVWPFCHREYVVVGEEGTNQSVDTQALVNVLYRTHYHEEEQGKP